MTQMVEHLSSKVGALSSNPSAAKRKKSGESVPITWLDL
jgi:hypothetical protein